MVLAVFGQRQLCKTVIKHGGSQRQHTCCKVGDIAHNIYRGIYMGIPVRTLSYHAPCAQRLPKKAQVLAPSPKLVTAIAAKPMSMMHDMDTHILRLHFAPPFSR